MKGNGKIYCGISRFNVIFLNGVLTSSVSTYDFSTLNATLLHYLIKETLSELIVHIFIERILFIWLIMKNELFFYYF